MLTPGLPASASNAGAKATSSAFSQRSQKDGTESFSSTLSAKSDRYDTRSVSDELKRADAKAQPEDQDAETVEPDTEEAPADRSVEAKSRPRQSVADLNLEFRTKRDTLDKAAAGVTAASKSGATSKNGADGALTDGDGSLIDPELAQEAKGPSDKTARSSGIAGSAKEAATGSDKTMPQTAQPAPDAKAAPEAKVGASVPTQEPSAPSLPNEGEATATAVQGDDWTLPAKGTTRSEATGGRDWTLPAKVEPKVLAAEASQQVGEVAADTRQALAKGETLQTGSAKGKDAVDADEPAGLPDPAVTGDTAGTSDSSGTVDAVLTLLGGTVAVRSEPARAAVAAKDAAADEASGRAGGKIDLGLSDGTVDPDALAMPDDPNAPTGNDRTFRFSSAREGQASMTMTIGAGADGTVRFDTARATASGAEGVMVLDSRRFLGFNQSANGAALTSAMVNDPEWTSAMQPGAALSNAAAQSSTGKVVNTLKLQMTPIELGVVTATLRLSGDDLTVHLTVQNRAAHAQLSEDSGGIMDALKSQGFSVDQVTVSIVTTAQTDTSQQPATDLGQRAQAGERQLDGGAGRGQQQGSTNQSAPQDTSGRRDNEPATDIGPAVIAGSARPQQLYI